MNAEERALRKKRNCAIRGTILSALHKADKLGIDRNKFMNLLVQYSQLYLDRENGFYDYEKEEGIDNEVEE